MRKGDAVEAGNTPSEQEVTKLLAAVTALRERVRPFTKSRSPQQRKEAARFPPGGDKVVSLVAEIATRKNVRLPDLSVDAMQDALALVGRIVPLHQAIAALEQLLSDTLLEARSRCWRIATAYYSAIARAGAVEPAVLGELRSALEFFGRRRGRNGSTHDEPENGASESPPVAPAAQ